jgi:hypothetical protein
VVVICSPPEGFFHVGLGCRAAEVIFNVDFSQGSAVEILPKAK